MNRRTDVPHGIMGGEGYRGELKELQSSLLTQPITDADISKTCTKFL